MADLTGEIVALSCVKADDDKDPAKVAEAEALAVCVAYVKETGQSITFTDAKDAFGLGDKVNVSITKTIV